MEKLIDARGQACPKPLVMARDGLKGMGEMSTLKVMVDNIISAENLEKMAKEMNLRSYKIQQGTDYIVSLFTEHSLLMSKYEQLEEYKSPPLENPLIAVIGSDQMGQGEERLGKLLLKGFLYSLSCLAELPQTIIFYNSGIKLLTEGSESLEDLQQLHDMGVELCACGTCVEYYQLKDKLALGSAVRIVNMLDIVTMQAKQVRVIKP